VSDMTELFYRLAGRIIRVIGPKNRMDCNDSALRMYAVNPSPWDITLEFAIVPRLSNADGELVYSEQTKKIYVSGDTSVRYEGTVSDSLDGAYIRIARKGNYSHVQIREDSIRESITARLVLNAMEAEHIIATNRGILLHASYIRYGSKAILFTAPSGTGKSTQAELWCRYRGAELINGDRSAIMVTERGIQAMGVPFSGSSGVCKDQTLPLAAIVYLNQNPVTEIQPLMGVNAFRRIWEGCSINVWNREDVTLSTDTVSAIVENIPVFFLACTPDESAVVALENALNMI